MGCLNFIPQMPGNQPDQGKASNREKLMRQTFLSFISPEWIRMHHEGLYHLMSDAFIIQLISKSKAIVTVQTAMLSQLCHHG